MMPSKAETKALVNRLSRAKGQLEGAMGMLEQGSDCTAAVTQLLAAANAIKSAAMLHLLDNFAKCAIDDKNNQELKKTITKLMIRTKR